MNVHEPLKYSQIRQNQIRTQAFFFYGIWILCSHSEQITVISDHLWKVEIYLGFVFTFQLSISAQR